MVLPVTLYGCKIWGFKIAELLKKIHNDFLRQIVGSRKSTPIYMLHAESGRHIIQINIKSRLIGFGISSVIPPLPTLARNIS